MRRKDWGKPFALASWVRVYMNIEAAIPSHQLNVPWFSNACAYTRGKLMKIDFSLTKDLEKSRLLSRVWRVAYVKEAKEFRLQKPQSHFPISIIQ
jgi:hypothetical protein